MDKLRPELKGPVLRGVLRDAKEMLAGGAAQLVAALPREVRQAHFGQNVLPGGWYPYETLSILLDTYSRLLAPGRPEAIQEVGARSAGRDLNTLLKAWSLVSSPSRIADMPAMIWRQRFRNAGEAASEKGDSSFRFTIAGFPGIHPLHCEMLTGYGRAWGRQWAKRFENTHDRCVHRGGADCSFFSSW
jgi:hypothetical protein